MIPIPADPFALPYSLKSDPLRGPLFIPLDTEALMGTKSYLFEGKLLCVFFFFLIVWNCCLERFIIFYENFCLEFPEETWAQRLVLFQESIALSFGFLACAVDSSQHQHNQYVHLSGRYGQSLGLSG